MINHRKIFFSFSILLSFLFITPLVFAAGSLDFQQKAQIYIDKSCDKKKLTNANSLLCYLFYKSEEQGIKIDAHEGRIAELETITPTQSFIPDKLVTVCFNVANGSLRVLQANDCGNDVQWQMPVTCVEGKPCKPDNPNDSYYLNNN